MNDRLRQFAKPNYKESLFALLLILVFWAAGLWSIINNYQIHQKLYLDKQISTQAVAWQAVDVIHRTGIEAYFNALVNQPEVLRLVKDAQDPAKAKMARLELYRELYPVYETLKNRGISIFHFHTADIKSLLRFHRPDKFGDDLKSKRHSLERVRSMQEPLHGFEVGFLYSGYRHIYPLLEHNVYLGSVELSQPFESLRTEMSRLNQEKEYVLIHQKSALTEKPLFTLGNLMQDSVFSSGDWLEEDPLRTLPGSPPVMTELMRTAAVQLAEHPDFQQQLSQGEPFARSVRLNRQFNVFVFTPVQDINHQNTAYVVSFAKSEELQLRLEEAVLLALGFTMIVLVLVVILFNWIQTKRAQEASLQFLENINDAMSEGMYVVDAQGYLTEINASALRFLGAKESEVIGEVALDLFLPKLEALQRRDISSTYRTDLQACRLEMESLCSSDQSFEGEYLFVGRQNQVIWVHLSSQPIYMQQKYIGKVVVFHDITVERSHKEQLRVAAAAFETQEGILITDSKGKIVRVNRSFSALTGYQAEEIIGKTPAVLSSGKQDKAFYKAMWQALLRDKSWQGEIWNRRKNGDLYLEWLTITAVVNALGEVTEYVAIFSDITEQKKAQDEIVKLAFYDSLTHLPNRRLLGERLSHALVTSERNKNYGSVIFIDLDNFKQLNDTKGHSAGDLLLKEVAKRLKSSVRDVDTVARLGGDEFVILLESIGLTSIEAMEAVELVAYKVLKTFELPFFLESGEHHTTPSLGVEVFQGVKLSAEQILQHADVAMYQAKQGGRNTACYFDPEMQQHIENALEMESELHKDQSEGFQQLQLYYQPQVDSDGKIQSVEALIRWLHPEKGLISPADFIPMIEKNGQIIAIGLWVISKACHQLAKWAQNALTQHLAIAVNVSAKQLVDESFAMQLHNILLETGASPALLKIELTESSVVENVESVIKVMQALQALGVELSMDDFGTGYSSLSYLKRLPLSQLKIDQAFVKDLETDTDSLAIVQTIIAMAKTLKLKVIAEGVETLGQKNCLEMQGCELFQGYYFSRPVPLADFEALISR
ncbi:MAG: EAL domain-containing protein [Thiotrichales bacterium]|nr:EAL domain-containing protein [Thiotrichales bacterium]